ncbi:MAG TPA: S9 family peptidase [Candidatus Paceibacterota bacterium]|nr:S9 family peptidase [Candidatus Paceibacterota bacterium]
MLNRTNLKTLTENNLFPSKAPKIPSSLQVHGIDLPDDYAWLRDRDNPEVKRYLEEENSYTEKMMQSKEHLQEMLFREMKARIKENDQSVPVQIDNYFYYFRTEKEKQYAFFCRKKDSLQSEEEIILDENQEAEGHEFFGLGFFEVSPDHKKLAYSFSLDGSDQYTAVVKNLESGELYPEKIENVSTSLEWNNDSKQFFYTTLDETLRPNQVFRHALGESPDQDVLIYQEPDEKFSVGVSKTRSKKYIFIDIGSKMTTEVRYFDASSDGSGAAIFHPRESSHEYFIDHRGEDFYILTNDQAENFRLMKTPVSQTGKEHWQEIIPHREEVKLSGMDLFSRHMVVYELREGVESLKVRNLETDEIHVIDFPEEVYSAGGSANPNFDTNIFRFSYTSFITPASVFSYNMDTRERELLKEDEVLGGYDANEYASERIYADASDGTRIPISVVYRKSLKANGTNPLWLTGYGAYGIMIRPGFSKTRLSLLDRGYIFAVAHVRGGGEGGEPWRNGGKFLKKKNTFTDFIACAEKILESGYTTREKLLISGGSAGGLLIGAVLNMRPDLFGAAIADVPFVDALRTMLDPTLPLTVGEYEEWGNPQEKEYFDAIREYAPYENVRVQDYPAILVQTGLNDTRVGYWEPAKWVAKLREMKTDKNPLLFKIQMGAGHSGASGRYDALKEIAFEYAFALSIFGVEK